VSRAAYTAADGRVARWIPLRPGLCFSDGTKGGGSAGSRNLEKGPMFIIIIILINAPDYYYTAQTTTTTTMTGGGDGWIKLMAVARRKVILRFARN